MRHWILARWIFMAGALYSSVNEHYEMAAAWVTCALICLATRTVLDAITGDL